MDARSQLDKMIDDSTTLVEFRENCSNYFFNKLPPVGRLRRKDVRRLMDNMIEYGSLYEKRKDNNPAIIKKLKDDNHRMTKALIEINNISPYNPEPYDIYRIANAALK